jgi:hypothetical protein
MKAGVRAIARDPRIRPAVTGAYERSQSTRRAARARLETPPVDPKTWGMQAVEPLWAVQNGRFGGFCRVGLRSPTLPGPSGALWAGPGRSIPGCSPGLARQEVLGKVSVHCQAGHALPSRLRSTRGRGSEPPTRRTSREAAGPGASSSRSRTRQGRSPPATGRGSRSPSRSWERTPARIRNGAACRRSSPGICLIKSGGATSRVVLTTPSTKLMGFGPSPVPVVMNVHAAITNN